MTRWIPVTMFLLSASPAFAAAGGQKAQASPVWREECSSCHVAYPPRLLPADSWRAVMAGLKTHFGTDASVDAKTASDIERFLVANAGMRPLRSMDGTPPLRITTTPWFLREHDEVPASTWKSAKVKSASNCTACHAGAEGDNFSDDSSGRSGGRR
ncbi:MAG: diheme cytochrome c [Vicinamibacterales bacterium]